MRGVGLKAGKAASADVAENLVTGPPARAFLAIFAEAGKVAADDALVLSRALSLARRPPSAAAVAEAWDAAGRLHRRISALSGPSRDVAAVELTQAMQGLMARDAEFRRGYSIAVAQALRLEQEARLARAIAKGALPEVSLGAGARVVARLEAALEDMSPALRKLWAAFANEEGAMEGVRLAASYGAQHAPAIAAARKLTGRAREQALNGYRSAVRGLLGEPWALADPAVRAIVEREIVAATKIAAATTGRTVEVFTQSAHQLQLNGAESVDMLVSLVSRGRDQRRMLEKLRVQVKIANVSEGAAQSVSDVYRSVGWKGLRDPWAIPTYSVTRGPGAKPEVFLVDTAASVRPRVLLVNPFGSRIPAKDLEALRTHLDVDEAILSRPTSELSALADSIIDAAVDVHLTDLAGS